MAVKKPLAKERAEELLRQVIDSPPHVPVPTGTAFRWEREQYVAWRKTRAALPETVDRDLLHRALVASSDISGWSDAEELPAYLDDAIVRLGEHFEATQPAWTFIMVAHRAGGGLRSLLTFERRLGWAGQRQRAQLVETLAAEPELLDGARAAYPLEAPSVTSRFLPLLAADGSPDSLDLLLPMFEAARTTGDNIDWIRRDIVPLLPDTAACRAFVADFTAAVLARTAQSPGRAFLVECGQDAATLPAVIKFTLTFKSAANRTSYAVKADSSEPWWLYGRPSSRWRWYALKPAEIAANIPAESVRYILRCGEGVARAPLLAWAAQLLPVS